MSTHIYNPVLDLILHLILLPALYYNFCADLARRVSYKSIKVHLTGIRLARLESGYPDPTTDEPLRLVIRGIQRLQGESPRQRLPITINILHTLKQQLCISTFSPVEQRLLWAAFTTAFYGFLRVGEFTCLQLHCSGRIYNYHQRH